MLSANPPNAVGKGDTLRAGRPSTATLCAPQGDRMRFPTMSQLKKHRSLGRQRNGNPARAGIDAGGVKAADQEDGDGLMGVG